MISASASERMRSPRAWGWTAGRAALRALHGEIPTRVGMDRDSHRPAARHRRDPHARGDGPLDAAPAQQTSLRSPRAWGWTDHDGRDHRRAGEIPTRVGMDRCLRPCSSSPTRDPHARGDGPGTPKDKRLKEKRSPRAWGWTARCSRPGTWPQEIPTRVGMDRRRPCRTQTSTRDPHARGDGPTIGASPEWRAERSPRAWGWTAARRARRPSRAEIPTRVGMDRGSGSLVTV